MAQYLVTGMSCAACQARVEKAVLGVPGVTNCAVSLLTNSMRVDGTASPAQVIKAVEKAGYGASLRGENDASRDGKTDDSAALVQDRETPKLIRRLVFSAVFLLVLMYITMGHNMWNWPVPPFFEHNHLGLALLQLLLAALVMVINQRFFINGFRALFSGAPNMDTLVSLGSAASFGWSVFVLLRMCGMVTRGDSNMDLMALYHDELYFESAAMIPALITVGKLLESISKGRTTNALRRLIALAPKQARLLKDGEEMLVDVENVIPGDLFALRPGDRVPVDGVVETGESAVDESALTGESVPVDKAVGDSVSAATINQSGFLTCRAVRTGKDTTLSRIIQMVSDAAATKAPIARIADKVSGVFVPAVIGIAVIVVLGWLLAGQSFSFALARGISVLVISCPCALGLATPVAVMVGNGLGARNGILIKTGEALEHIGKVQTVVLDKTGTITQGIPTVTDIVPFEGVTAQDLLQKAYSLEVKSEHPLAKAIVAHAKALDLSPAASDEFRIFPGNGLEAVVDGKRLLGGSKRFLASAIKGNDALFAAGDALASSGKTPLYFAEDDNLIGLIAVADVIKETSPAAIRSLRNLGLRVLMLTGDNEQTAAAIGKEAGVSDVIAGVLPDRKEEVIRSLQREGKVAMVGDGINDAPALTRADVGLAIGAGTDVAIDSADIVLMNSDLADVAACVRLGRGTLRNIHENLFWAFFYNMICIPLAAGLFGWKMNPMIAAAAMSLSSVTVCLNALRLNLLHIKDSRRDRPRRNRRSKISPALPQAGSDAVCLRVEGMMCEHCEKTVQDALGALPFIETASADHNAGTVAVTLTGAMDVPAVKAALKEKGYRLEGILD